MPPFKRKSEYVRLITLLSGVLPLVLGLLFSAIEARHTVKQQQALAANTLLVQAEKVSDSAWEMIDWLHKYHDKPCPKIAGVLQREGVLNAYFRGIGKLDGANVTCSSAYGTKLISFSKMFPGTSPPGGSAKWSRSLLNTQSVTDRPAILFVQRLENGQGFWALIDGQYLTDFMHVVGDAHDHLITMRFNQGDAVSVGTKPAASTVMFKQQRYQTHSSRYPIDVTIITSGAELMRTWQQVLLIFLPMTAILSVLLMVLTYHWLRRHFSWRDEIRRGIRMGQFSVHYQPVYDVNTQRCSGVEALMRWTLPNGQTIRPDVFISAAEAEGMIIPLTRHLLDLIVRDVQDWPTAAGFHLNINVAADHLQHASFEEDMQNFAARVACKQLVLVLELTERNLIREGEKVAQKLHHLRQKGMQVAIDDFGTGHCSFSYLQTFPLDCLKIDRGFINTITSSGNQTPILDAIISLSLQLEMKVLGEGVENAAQYRYLRQHAVSYIQGYFYARPMDNAAFIAWFTRHGQQPVSAG